MSTLRELLAHDISHGDMAQSPNEETGADRIGALARADPLGAALWRVTGNMDPASFVEARGYLTGRLRLKYASIPIGVLRAVSQQAMEEWLVCLCERCAGRKFIIDEDSGTRRTCPECNGTGKGTHSEKERISKLGCVASVYVQLAPVFADAHTMLHAADARVQRQVLYQLERRKYLFRNK